MEARLEEICFAVDGVLEQQGLSAKVAGGYVAGNGLLLSLSDTTFCKDAVRIAVAEQLSAQQVMATVGVLLVHGIDFNANADVVEGEYVVVPETVDMMELIAEAEHGQ